MIKLLKEILGDIDHYLGLSKNPAINDNLTEIGNKLNKFIIEEEKIKKSLIEQRAVVSLEESTIKIQSVIEIEKVGEYTKIRIPSYQEFKDVKISIKDNCVKLDNGVEIKF